MNKNRFKVAFLGLIALLTVSVSYACYPGLDCPDDLPGDTKKTPSADDWQMEGRYQLKGGLVKDPTTGLMWMRCSFGQTWNGSSCQGKAAEVTWEQAMNITQHFDYSAYSDWEVPTLEELKTLVYCNNGQSVTVDGCAGDYTRPTIVQAVFPETPPSKFWSSSSSASNGGEMFIVDFYAGAYVSENKDSYNAIRLVRRGR